jgi:hypothetical protein
MDFATFGFSIFQTMGVCKGYPAMVGLSNGSHRFWYEEIRCDGNTQNLDGFICRPHSCGGLRRGGSDSSNPMVVSSTGAAVTLENAFPNLAFNQPGGAFAAPSRCSPAVCCGAGFTNMDSGISADPMTEEISLSVDRPFGNHNGSHITFGPFDG